MFPIQIEVNRTICATLYSVVNKKVTVLLSTSLACPAWAGCNWAELFSQPGTNFFAQPCMYLAPREACIQPSSHICVPISLSLSLSLSLPPLSLSPPKAELRFLVGKSPCHLLRAAAAGGFPHTYSAAASSTSSSFFLLLGAICIL